MDHGVYMVHTDIGSDGELHEFCVELITKAGEFTLEFFQQASLEVEHKGDGTPVTVADRGAEDLIRSEISKRYPNDAIVGEEAGTSVGTSGRRWIIDPIDGTKAFSRGVGLYTNLLCVEDNDGPITGAINIPALGELVHAQREAGCFLNGVTCGVSDVSDPTMATLTTTGFNYWDSDMLNRAHKSGPLLRTWGDGYGYALVASGRAEIMIDPVINYWDIAPCRVIIPEAGGVFTTVEGDAYVSNSEGESISSMATNAALHSWTVEMLNGA